MRKNKLQFKKGRIPWNKGLTKEIDERVRRYAEKVGKSRRGKKCSEESNRKKSTASKLWHKKNKGTKKYKEMYERITKSREGYKHSEETKKKIGKKSKGRPAWNKGLTKETDSRIRMYIEAKKGYKHSKKTKRKLSEAHKRIEHPQLDRTGSITSEETKRKLRKIGIEKWYNDEEYRKKVITNAVKGLLKRPTSYEKKIAELCIENSLPFIYTGNGTFLINFKNPDFVNFKDRVVIEVFYSWFKIRDYGSVENYKEFCRKKYNPKGWKVIFIDENEIDNKELCLNKIITFSA